MGENDELKRKLQNLEKELANKDKTLQLCDRELQKMEEQLHARDAKIKQREARMLELEDELGKEDKHAGLVEIYKHRCNNAARETDDVRKELGSCVGRLLEAKKAREVRQDEADAVKNLYEKTDSLFISQKNQFEAAKKIFEDSVRNRQKQIDCLHIVLSHHGIYEAPNIVNPEDIEFEETLEVKPLSDLSSACSSWSAPKFSFELDSYQKCAEDFFDNVSALSDDTASVISDSCLNDLAPKVQARLKQLHALMDATKAELPKKSRSDLRKFFKAPFSKKADVGCTKSEVDAGQPKTSELNEAETADKAELAPKNLRRVKRKISIPPVNMTRVLRLLATNPGIYSI